MPLPLVELIREAGAQSLELNLSGRRVRYVDLGPRDAEVLLLAHGNMGSWENFARWFPVLISRFRLLIPDLPGCGGSEPPPPPASVAGYADFMADFLAELGVRRLGVGGLCMGSQVALELVRRHGHELEVTRLLLHTPPYSQAAISSFLRRQVRVASFPPLFWLLRSMQRNDVIFNRYKRHFIEGTGLIEEDNLMNSTNQRRADARTALSIGQDSLRQDYTELLRGLAIPTWVITPERDVLVELAVVMELGSLMPNCHIEIIRAAGHGWTPAFVHAQNEVLARFAAEA